MAEREEMAWRGCLRRTGAVAAHTLSEAVRMRLARLLVVTGGAMVWLGVWLREFNFGSGELRFLGDFGLGGIGLASGLLAALATAQVYFEAVDGTVVGMVLSRALRRWELVVGLLGGILALLGLALLVLVSVLGALLAHRAAELGADAMPWGMLLQAGALLWLKAGLIAAMTLLVCSYASNALFASLGGLGFALIAHLPGLLGRTSRLDWLRVWPNLALFDPDLVLRHGRALEATVLLGLVGYWSAAMAGLLVIASYVFSRREF